MFHGKVYILRSRDLHVTLFSTTNALFLVVLRLMHLCHSYIIILRYVNIDRLVYCAVLYRPIVFRFEVYRKVQSQDFIMVMRFSPVILINVPFSVFINYHKAVLSTVF